MSESELTVNPLSSSRSAKAFMVPQGYHCEYGTWSYSNIQQGFIDRRSWISRTVKNTIIDLELGYSHPIEHAIPESFLQFR